MVERTLKYILIFVPSIPALVFPSIATRETMFVLDCWWWVDAGPAVDIGGLPARE